MYRMHEVDPQNYRPCPRCFGKGRITCKKCKGRGELSRYREGVSGQVLEFSTCPECSDPGQLRGTGRGSFECPKCHGSGDEKIEQRLKASNAEQIREVGSPVPGNESSYHELRERFDAARKVALDSLDGQAISPYERELRRERLRKIEFTVVASIDLATVWNGSPPTPYEERKLKELGLEPQKVDSSNYPDYESHLEQQLTAMLEMLRIFYWAAARGIL